MECFIYANDILLNGAFYSFFQGSRDNMSIIIIAFPAAPKIDQEAKRKDQELDRLLKQKVEGESDRQFAF